MRILGIETSCDETAVAIIDVAGSRVRPRIRVLANVVTSQAKLHSKYGGVVPHLAKREHQRNLVPILLTALKESGLLRRESGIKKHESRRRKKSRASHDSKFMILVSILKREPELLTAVEHRLLLFPPPDVDAIAVTVGPGLAPALWVGVNFARALAYLWEKPLIPVNHLEGHIYTNVLPASGKGIAYRGQGIAHRRPKPYSLSPISLPALCLIVSGGHTELVLMRRYGDYRVIGETLDDAAGEAFDKVAKMMGLGFPGGPIVSKLAERGNPRVFNFPRPMLHSKDFNFSFSGLKTAVLYKIHDRGNRTTKFLAQEKADVAASFEQAVVDVLVQKTIRAAEHYRVKTVMIGGGVAANARLRSQLGQALRISLPSTYYLTPNTSLTGDNALMIALAGWFSRKKKAAWRSLQAVANLRLDRR